MKYTNEDKKIWQYGEPASYFEERVWYSITKGQRLYLRRFLPKMTKKEWHTLSEEQQKYLKRYLPEILKK